ncbi:hypothetical protein NQ318_000807 [Aromia moschata]|uniref:Serpin domain-containing protein n=1 Tax=Aromia moschata TaxID=1265417 RepID=A0AAV8X100_9CUCU|nr:hypothetical protein NQ318_000807 [Aromia moschata]
MAEFKLVDFSKSEAAAGSINDWVEKKTNNKIRDLISVDSLNHLTRLVLVNAIYFKGTWQEKFKPARTATRKFYLNDEDTIENNENMNAKVLQLLFVNNNVSLVVILPNERTGIADLKEKLAGGDLTKITGNMRRRKVYVKLPKFRIEQTIDLKEPLTEMGLGNIFTEYADFSDTIKTSQRLCVSEVVQKVFMEVNEEGAEAAADTSKRYLLLIIIEVRKCVLQRKTRHYKTL